MKALHLGSFALIFGLQVGQWWLTISPVFSKSISLVVHEADGVPESVSEVR